MADFDRTKFISALTHSATFTPAQVETLADALEASFGGAVVSGESRKSPPLRGAAVDLS